MKETDPRFAESVFWVHATDTETHELWCKFHNVVDWVQDGMGLSTQIGVSNGKPVCMSVFWNILNGQRVLFYECTSQLADYELVDKWVSENCKVKYDKGTRRAHTNAMNFAHCFHFVTEGVEIPLWYIISERENEEIFITRIKKVANSYHVRDCMFDDEVADVLRKHADRRLIRLL